MDNDDSWLNTFKRISLGHEKGCDHYSTSGIKLTHHKLLEAAFNGDLRRVQKLAAKIDDGSGIGITLASVKDSMNQRAIHTAATEGRVNICKYWISDLELEVDIQDATGTTPLHRAILGGHVSTSKYLLEKHANPNIANDNGYTPLHCAAEKGHRELLLLLLSRGANVNALSSIGTPLQIAARKGKYEAVDVLLDHEANVGLYVHHLPSPLSASVLAKSLPCLKRLIRAGADPNEASCGATPLHFAAYEGETEIIKCLVRANADCNVTNKDGMKPIEVAALKSNHQDIRELMCWTTPMFTYPEWTVNGIIKHVHLEEERHREENSLM